MRQDKSSFKWRHFEPTLILLCVRWYCRFQLSYRDLEEMMNERGLSVDHTTVFRWVQRYAPEINKRIRWIFRPEIEPFSARKLSHFISYIQYPVSFPLTLRPAGGKDAEDGPSQIRQFSAALDFTCQNHLEKTLQLSRSVLISSGLFE